MNTFYIWWTQPTSHPWIIISYIWPL